MRSVLLLLAVLAATPEHADPPADISGAGSPLLPNLCAAWAGEGATGALGPVLQCSGLVGTDVYLSGPPEARSVALGTPPAFGPPPPGTSTLGRSINWRILGDRPLAGILRYRLAPPPGEADGPVLLAILKPGTDRRPGCLVGVVGEGGGEDALPVASDLADARAAGFRCGVDRPLVAGAVSGAAGEAIRAWLAR